jgi:hypothetical protein
MSDDYSASAPAPEAGAPYGAPPVASAPPPTMDEPPQMSAAGRLGNIFFAPGDVFEDIRRSPRGWWLPIIILALLSAAAGFAIQQRFNLSAERASEIAIEAQLEKEGKVWKDMSPEERRPYEMGKQWGATMGKFSSVLTILGLPIVIAVIAGIYRLLLLIFQAETTFSRVLGATAHAYFAPGIVQTLLLVVMSFLRSPDDVDMRELVQGRGLLTTSLAFLVSAKEHPVLAKVLGFADVFSIWWVVLAIIGIAAVTKKGRVGTAAAVVLIPYALYMLVSIGTAAVSGGR